MRSAHFILTVPSAKARSSRFIPVAITIGLLSIQLVDAGSFSLTGSMKTARIKPAAVLLPNGNVLVVGGTSPASSIAELYTPTTGSWTLTGNMITAREATTAILLPNGKVLVAGGGGDQNIAFSSAEIYDPSTGKWTSTGSLNTPRISQAILLANGKVMMAGGLGSSLTILSSCEVFDRLTGKWTLTGSVNTGRSGLSSVLGNGKVLIAGGIREVLSNGPYLSSSELYDVTTGKWTPTGTLALPRSTHTMTSLSNGQVLVAGGLDFDSRGAPYSLSSAELYHSSTGNWVPTGEMDAERSTHTATLLKNGKVLAAGGYSASPFSSARLSSAEIYDPTTGMWISTGTLSVARNAHTAVLLQSGKVLIVGGFDDTTSSLSSAELYDSGDSVPVYAGAKASYSGLFYQPHEVTIQSSGFFNVATTAKGTFSAKLLLAGNKYMASGKFTADGTASVSVTRKGTSPLTLTLQMESSGDVLTGIVSDGTWTAELLADRSVFNSKTNPAPNSGEYTIVIPGIANSSTSPGGHGVGTITVDASGIVKFAGTLGEGTKVSQSAPLSSQRKWPLYVSIYKGNGSLLSRVAFTDKISSSLEGELNWIKGGSFTSGFYPKGFTNEISVTGSIYQAPINQTWGLNFGTGQVGLERGNIGAFLFHNVTIGPNHVVVASDGPINGLNLKCTLASGLLKGSFIHPATGKKTPINGVILQKQNNARGFFLGTNESGAFSLEGN